MYTTGLKLPLVETSIYFPGYGHSATQDENIMWQQSARSGHPFNRLRCHLNGRSTRNPVLRLMQNLLERLLE